MRAKSVLAGLMVFAAAVCSAGEGGVADAVFVMTSKGVYETCEDMWFKAYVLDASTRRLSDKSHVLFLQIADPADSVVWSEQYPVYGGRASGQVYVGEDWTPGEYTVSAVCRSSFAHDSTAAFMPRKIMVVDNLEQMDSVYKSRSAAVASSTGEKGSGSLRISIGMDTTAFRTHAKVKLDIEVTDSAGRPVQAEVALSVFDWLYHYPWAYDDIVAHYNNADVPSGEAFLPDGVAGHISIGSKRMAKKMDTAGEQFLTAFAPEGPTNVLGSDAAGDFCVDRDMLATLPRYFFMKPVSGKELKPQIEIYDPAKDIERLIAARPGRVSLSAINARLDGDDDIPLMDTMPSLAGRRIYHLDDLEVTAKVRYRKRDKFYGYLDSITSMDGGAWVCGCNSSVGTFLNDYEAGYTHHPAWANDYQPMEHTRPVKGKTYEMIKYLPGGETGRGYVADIKYVVWTGEEYSEEELLKANGMWKAKGLYPDVKFDVPTEEDVRAGLFDNANTLLWAPSLLTDEHGKAEVEFYTSDISSVFYVVANAIDGNGGIGAAAVAFRTVGE